jgi:CheY-like chemotaxis protein
VSQRHRHTIVLVEDDRDSRVGVAELLRLDGYMVVEASDGREALQCLQDGLRPCLVLLDLNMPGVSGWQFRAMQLLDHQISMIPVVALSGHGGLAQQANILEMAGYLTKPLDVDRLLAIIGNTCDRAAEPGDRAEYGLVGSASG